jgi:hypothetical protein
MGFEGRGEIGGNEILSGFVDRTSRQQNRTAAEASQVGSDGKSARVGARSLCAGQCVLPLLALASLSQQLHRRGIGPLFF